MEQIKSDVESFRLKFISKKGAIAELFENLKQIPSEKKKEFGKILNELKQTAEKVEFFKHLASLTGKNLRSKKNQDFGKE